MLPITSIHNPRVKAAAKLRQRRDRDAHGQCLIDGVRETISALSAGVHIDELLVCPELLGDRLATLQSAALPSTTWLALTPEVFAKVAYGDRAEGVVAVATPPHRALASWRLPPDAVLGVLVGVEKPGNVGAVFRTADAAGLAGLVLAGVAGDPYNANAIRASLGTVFRVPWAAAGEAEVLAWLRQEKLPLFAARVEGAKLYHTADYRAGGAIILGSEADGLGEAWTAPDITPIRLPMNGAVDSLNISAAAAVLFYEAWRQKHGA